MTKHEKGMVKKFIRHYEQWAGIYYDEGNTEMSEWCASKCRAVEDLLIWLDIDIDELMK